MSVPVPHIKLAASFVVRGLVSRVSVPPSVSIIFPEIVESEMALLVSVTPVPTLLRSCLAVLSVKGQFVN